MDSRTTGTASATCFAAASGDKVCLSVRYVAMETRMTELVRFREAVRTHRRIVGRSQQQLANALGLHPNVLSHKLNGHGQATLTTREVVGIVTTLADWGALPSREDAKGLLHLGGVRPHAAEALWKQPPLSVLPADAVAAPGPPAARAPRQGNLKLAPPSVPTPSLIGRERERAEVAAALDAARLVTLTGVGGTGKTRLALQVAADVADRYADGVAFVSLSSVRDPALLPTAIAAACGLSPSTADEAEVMIIDVLNNRHVLVVVDNLEQLVEGTPLLSRVLAAAPGLRVLATSRVPLRLYGEQTLRVPPLSLEGDGGDAVRLFIARARAARRDFEPGPYELRTIAVICAALDGLPLAIELAAAKVRLYSPTELLPLLDSRLALLHGGPRDVPDRQQTLRAALDWSYTLMSPSAQHVLACLSVFAGRFDVAAASAVSDEADEYVTRELLTELHDQSMIEAGTTSDPRFALLQTVREYASARLAESGGEDAAEQRNLRHHVLLAAALQDDIAGAAHGQAISTLERAYPNIRVALDFAGRHGRTDESSLVDGLRLAAAVGPMWSLRGPLAEGRLHLERLLAVEDERPIADVGVRAAAALTLAAQGCYAGDYEMAAARSERAIELFSQLDDQQGLARAYRYRGESSYSRGDLAAARGLFERSLAAARRSGDAALEASAANMAGQLARDEGRLHEASTLLRRAVSIFQVAQMTSAVPAALHSLGEVERDVGHAQTATDMFCAALRIGATIGNMRPIAGAFEGLASMASIAGDHERALTFAGVAWATRDQVGSRLPPVDVRALEVVLAPTLNLFSVPDRDAVLSRGRSVPLPDAISAAMSMASPAIASASDAELADWIRKHTQP